MCSTHSAGAAGFILQSCEQTSGAKLKNNAMSGVLRNNCVRRLNSSI